MIGPSTILVVYTKTNGNPTGQAVEIKRNNSRNAKMVIMKRNTDFMDYLPNLVKYSEVFEAEYQVLLAEVGRNQSMKGI